MASLQSAIDTICSKLTVESMYQMIKLRLEGGPFGVDQIVPAIQVADRSLDRDSARMLGEAAMQELAQKGEIKLDGERVYPVP